MTNLNNTNLFILTSRRYGITKRISVEIHAGREESRALYSSIVEWQYEVTKRERPFNFMVEFGPFIYPLHHITSQHITLPYITLPSFQTQLTPKVTSGASTITCYTKYSPPAQHAGYLHNKSGTTKKEIQLRSGANCSNTHNIISSVAPHQRMSLTSYPGLDTHI